MVMPALMEMVLNGGDPYQEPRFPVSAGQLKCEGEIVERLHAGQTIQPPTGLGQRS